MLVEKQENLEFFENSYWIEKFSGKLVRIENFDYLYDDDDWMDTFQPMGVRFSYEDGSTEFVGIEMFKSNYRYHRKDLSRLELVEAIRE